LMGQREIIAWLSANPGWHRTDDIVPALDQCYRAVDRSLVKAARSGDIKSRKAQYAKEWSA
jgi:hypothetical protein